MTIIWNMASPAGSQFLIAHFIRGLPSSSFSSVLSASFTILLVVVVSLPSSLCLLLLEVHDGVEDHVDGVEDVHAEGTFAVVSLLLAPLLCLGVEY